MKLRIQLVTPAARGSRSGNRVGAERWAAFLRDLGHRVVVDAAGEPEDADLLIALHARKSAGAVRAFREAHPGRPIAVVLTGTDLYGDLPRGDRSTLATIAVANRLVLLQPQALRALPRRFAEKARVILQSAPKIAPRPAPRVRTFDVCVVGHLREVKDPLRAARAARLLPSSSRVSVLQAGAAIDARLARAAEAEMQKNARYRWLGELSRRKSLRLIARSRAMVISSRAEGGAHVVSEAIVAGTPVLASRIPGNLGMLGEDYPGSFPAGDTHALADLLCRMEGDAVFRRRLTHWCRALGPAHAPRREREALRALLGELVLTSEV